MEIKKVVGKTNGHCHGHCYGHCTGTVRALYGHCRRSIPRLVASTTAHVVVHSCSFLTLLRTGTERCNFCLCVQDLCLRKWSGHLRSRSPLLYVVQPHFVVDSGLE